MLGKKIKNWLLLKNPGGLALLLTAWIFGGLYAAADFLDLIEDANSPFMLKFCLIVGIVLFVTAPLILKLDKK